MTPSITIRIKYCMFVELDNRKEFNLNNISTEATFEDLQKLIGEKVSCHAKDIFITYHQKRYNYENKDMLLKDIKSIEDKISLPIDGIKGVWAGYCLFT